MLYCIEYLFFYFSLIVFFSLSFNIVIGTNNYSQKKGPFGKSFSYSWKIIRGREETLGRVPGWDWDNRLVLARQELNLRF